MNCLCLGCGAEWQVSDATDLRRHQCARHPGQLQSSSQVIADLKRLAIFGTLDDVTATVATEKEIRAALRACVAVCQHCADLADRDLRSIETFASSAGDTISPLEAIDAIRAIVAFRRGAPIDRS